MSKKGKLRSIHIEAAGNGYSVKAHHDMPTGKQGTTSEPMGPGSSMPENEPMVFQKKKHVMDHVSGLLNDNDGDEGNQAPVPADHPVKKLQRRGF